MRNSLVVIDRGDARTRSPGSGWLEAAPSPTENHPLYAGCHFSVGSVNLASELITRVLITCSVDVSPFSPGATRHLVCAVGILILLIAEPARAQGFKWWQSEAVQQDLHLTVGQIKEIEQIYDASLPERRRLRADLDRLEQQLQQLLDRAEVDERDAALLIDRVETARARRNSARTIMLFRIGRVLTPQQRTALAQRAVKRQ